MGEGFFGGLLDLLVGGVEAAVADIFSDGGMEEEGLLVDDADPAAEGGLGDGFDIGAIDEDGALGGVVEAHEEAEEGGFSGAAGTDEGVGFAVFEDEGDIFKGGLVPVGLVGEGDVIELDAALAVFEGGGVRGVLDLGGAVHEFEDFGGGDDAFLEEDLDAGEGFGVGVHRDEGDEEHEELGGGHAAVPGVEEAEGDAEGGDGFDERADEFDGFAPAHDEAHHLLGCAVELLFFEVLAPVGFDDADACEAFLHGDHEEAGLLLLAAAGLADFFADDDDGEEGEGEDDEGGDGEEGVAVEEVEDDGDDGDGVLDEVAGDGDGGALGLAGLVESGLDEFADFGLVVEVEALVDEAGEEVAAEVVDDFVADPEHAVFVEVFEEAADEHHEGDGGAGEDDDGESAAVGGGWRCDFGIDEGDFDGFGGGGTREDEIEDGLEEEEHDAAEEAGEDAEDDPEDEAGPVGFDVAEELEVGDFGGGDELGGGHVCDIAPGEFFDALRFFAHSAGGLVCLAGAAGSGVAGRGRRGIR